MDWQSLGVGGLVVVFVIRELFAYLRQREGGKMEGQVAELWHAHLGAGARDADGGLRWYMKASTVDAIEDTAALLREVVRLLKAQGTK